MCWNSLEIVIFIDVGVVSSLDFGSSSVYITSPFDMTTIEVFDMFLAFWYDKMSQI